MLSAQLGLEPNSPLQEAYLIPYKNQCQFQIGYRGLLKLTWNSGMIEMIDFDKICENDYFEYQKGFEQLFIHKPLIKGDRGSAIAYYAIAQIKGGGKAMFIASKDDILKHARKFSKTFNNGPWQSDFDSMAIKTVLKQLIDKKLPKATTKEMLRLMEAINRDDTAQEITKSQLGNDKIDIEDIVTIADYEVIQETGEIKESQEPKDTLL
jgi:recombination protein RecT